MKLAADISYRTLFRVVTVLLCVAVIVGGCSPRPEKLSPPLDVPEGFSDSGSGRVPDHWWTVFGEESLNRLVDKALRSNFTLKTVWQRLQEARAIADRQSSSLFPVLDGFVRGEISRAESVEQEELRLGLSAEYEVDLWGRIGSAIEAERYRVQAGQADYRTAALTLTAEVVRTWCRLMESRHQIDLASQQIATNEKMLDLIKTRFHSGQNGIADILRQQQLLEASREQKLAVESRRQVLEHQLNVLLGGPPRRELGLTPSRLPALSSLPATGLPAELLRRRPDVRAAFNELQAADRDLAAAISHRYPRLTLTASISSAEDNAEDLFKDWSRTLSGNLLAPLFDAGRREAEVDRNRSLKMQRLYEYGQTILTAFQEVEDALIQEKKQAARINSLEEQVSLAGLTYKRLQDEYFNGAGDYIDVLLALTEEQELQRDLLSARLILLEFRIALYRALAGGFETRRESGDMS